MNIQNITIKNAAAADVVYTAVRPQGGESTPALWLVKTGSRNSQERLEALVRRSASNQGWKTTLKVTLPIMDSVDPNKKLTNVVVDLTLTSPDVISDAVANDVAIKLKNLVAHADIQKMLANQEPAV